MRRHPVESSAVSSIGYKGGVLEVEFTSGNIYRYRNVAPDIYETFRAAESKGRFFDFEIRDHYPFERVR